MKKILEYAVALLIILECNTVYFWNINQNFFITEMLIVFILFLFIYNLMSYRMHNKSYLNKKSILFLFLYYAYILLFMILTKTKDGSFIKLFIIIYPLLVLMYSQKNFKKQSIIEKIPNIVVILAIISIALWILGPLTKVLKPTGYMYIDWGEVRRIPAYFGIHFYTQSAGLFGKLVVRNTGIFTEGPMYSLILTIALITEVFITKRKSPKVIFVLLITIFTTISTSGIVVGIVVLFIDFIITKNKGNVVKSLKLMILPFVLLSIILIIGYFIGVKRTSFSYYTRMDDYVASFKAWKQHPVLGNGFKNEDSIIKFMSRARKKNTGLSNSILVVLALDGIYLSITYFVPFIKSFANSIKNKNIRLFIFTTMVLILFTTIIFPYKVLIFNLLAFFITQKKDEPEEEQS